MKDVAFSSSGLEGDLGVLESKVQSWTESQKESPLWRECLRHTKSVKWWQTYTPQPPNHPKVQPGMSKVPILYTSDHRYWELEQITRKLDDKVSGT